MQKLWACCLSLNWSLGKERIELKRKLVFISFPSYWQNFNIGRLEIVLIMRSELARQWGFTGVFRCVQAVAFGVHEYFLALEPSLWKSVWKETLFQRNSELSILGMIFTYNASNARMRDLLSLSWKTGQLCEQVWQPRLIHVKLWLSEFCSVLLNIKKFVKWNKSINVIC